jgi:hypothetical protein
MLEIYSTSACCHYPKTRSTSAIVIQLHMFEADVFNLPTEVLWDH